MTMTATEATKITRDICGKVPVLPVLVIDDAALARPLAEALIAGGLTVLEVTLRTPAALDAIREMAEVPGSHVGAGTLITPDDVQAAKAAGARFGVSPGATAALMDACEAVDLPLLPGAATATEAMALLERGYAMQKFFPAEASGGAPALAAIGGPLPQISFCPTGGIGAGNAEQYLRLGNVICVGGSWTAPRDLLEARDWDAITALARATLKLANG